MGRKEEDGVERTEGGVVVVNPKPQKGLTAKAIDLLEWVIVKLMHDSSKPLHYLQGNFAPADETPPLNDLVVQGHLPECLNGEFVRVGPNPKFAPVAGYHWFDGDGMIHGLRIKDGKATYVSRYVRTSRLKQEEFFGGAKFMKVGDLKGLFGVFTVYMQMLRTKLKVLDISYGNSTANTALVYHHGKLLALSEADKPYALRVLEDGDLQTLGMLDYDKRLTHSFTAHPKVDPVTGEMFTFGYAHTPPYITYRVISKDGIMQDPVPITIPEPIMMHDFAITENYAIIMDLPLCFRPKEMVKNNKLAFTFDATKKARFGVLPRYANNEALIRWFELPNCFIFHNEVGSISRLSAILEMRGCPIISTEECRLLEAPFEEQEIQESIKACAGDKVPGPDGFTMAFFSQCWDIIRHDVVATLQNFHSRSTFERSINATFVALIPKKAGAIELNDFRPISLVGGVYKISSKLLAGRVKKLIHKLVDRQQMTFIKGRQITDAVLIANELVDYREKCKKSGILCKLDIQKAYDHLNWRFLVNVLQKMGFGTRWISWIKECISTVRFSMLINRSPTGFFTSQRGLRQGDPISPFLFILAMEGLSNLLYTAKIKRWIRGFQVLDREEENFEITHLQYADDTLVFCDAVKANCLVLRAIFILFEAVSGLHINWGKSFIYPINEVTNIEDLALTLGGKVGVLPTVYLDMPLGARSRSKSIWSGVLERCERKLTNWKGQYLSRGGRLTLISSVLNVLPTYMMSIFPAPAWVIQGLDTISRTFFWQGNEDKRKYHLVKWEELITSKKTGGGGIRNLRCHNQSLMMKWLWKFAFDDNFLWKEVVAVKYGMEDKWMTPVVFSPYGSSVWRSIRNFWGLLLGKTSCKVGNGRKISFWKDKWCGQLTLRQRFPEMYEMSQNQQACIAEMWQDKSWNLHFRRDFNDWELGIIADLLVTINQFKDLSEEGDSLVWEGESGRGLTVSSAYNLFVPTGSEIDDWPWKMIWKAKIPYKVNCFTWLLAKEAILTHDNLNKRGHHLCSRCFLCEDQRETVNHLFLHCTWTEQL